jgi:hypothetical protein
MGDKAFAEYLEIAIDEFQKSPCVPKPDEIKSKSFTIFNP